MGKSEIICGSRMGEEGQSTSVSQKILSRTDLRGAAECVAEHRFAYGRLGRHGDCSAERDLTAERNWYVGKDLASAYCAAPLWIAGVLFRISESRAEGWA